MASGTRAYKQDLPPKGGYAPIQKVRIPAKQWMGGYWPAVFGMGILSAQWWLFFRKNREETKKKQLEMRGMQLALQPLLAAERDRAFIKHWKNVVEGEKDLMKDVPGWVPGTWWGEPVFKTVPHEK